MTHGPEKSDLSIVAMKLANKSGQPEAETVERRERAEGNELCALLPVVGRARNCAADAGFPHRPMRRIPEGGSCLPCVVGLHGVAAGTIRASNSNGSGLAPRFHLLVDPC
jgi:hypothetical protein